MINKNSKLASYLIITIILTLGLSISFQSLLAQWQAPGSVPPGDNIEAPINEGTATQSKAGSLNILGDFSIDGLTSFKGQIDTISGVSNNLIPDPLFSSGNYWNNTSKWIQEKVVMDNGDIVNSCKITTTGNVQVYSDFIPVDPHKTYRFSIWIKENNNDSRLYLGYDAYSDTGAEIGSYNTSGTVGTNYYFWNGDIVPVNQWRKITGYILPCNAGTAWTNPDDSTSNNYRMGCNTKYLRMRFLNYDAPSYGTGAGTTAWFALPQVEEVTESSPAYSKNFSDYIINPAGNVGIGTNNPSAKFEINGGAKINGNLKIGSNSDVCDAGHAGEIKWNGANFTGCDGSDWLVLDQTSSNWLVNAEHTEEQCVLQGGTVGVCGSDSCCIFTINQVQIECPGNFTSLGWTTTESVTCNVPNDLNCEQSTQAACIAVPGTSGYKSCSTGEHTWSLFDFIDNNSDKEVCSQKFGVWYEFEWAGLKTLPFDTHMYRYQADSDSVYNKSCLWQTSIGSMPAGCKSDLATIEIADNNYCFSVIKEIGCY